ncbi:MAG TPA: hypothetical protein PLT04_04820 [Candidatus Saccharibacteria bacterium]|nr:hypothetical protein [Candidatus Saccharibacteria bacterium]
MVQFNLLPDVKLNFIKTRRQKHTITTISFLMMAVCVGLLLLSFMVANVVQKQILKKADNDIKSRTQTLREVPDINKVLTVQSQLKTLPGLHDKKQVTSRVFGYLTQVTPSQISLNKLSLDYTVSTLSVTGTSPTIDIVRVYADTLKRTTFQIKGAEGSNKAFSEVVLSNFGKSDTTGTTFTLTMKFNEQLFNPTNEVTLVVPANAGASQSSIFEEKR